MREAWLELFLKKEVKLNLWEFRTPDGFPLWALLRQKVLIATSKNEEIYGSMPKKIMSRSTLLLRFFLEHCRAFATLFLDCTPSFDAVFFTPAHYLNNPQNGEKYRDDRVHGAYYPLFSKPLILETLNNGFFSRRINGVEPNNVFLQSSIYLVYVFLQKLQRVSFPVSEQEEMTYSEIAEKACIISNGEFRKEEAIELLKKTRHLDWMYKRIAARIAVKLKQKVAFIHGGCYLGDTAFLIWHLHQSGIRVVEPQHGYVGSNHRAYNYPEEIFDLPGVRTLFPDYFLTFGEHWGEPLSIPSHIIPVGNPYLESMVKKHANQANTDILLILSATDRITNLVPFLSKAFPERKVVLKLHPRESAFAEQYRELENLPNVLVKGAKNESILPLIANADIIVGFASTALFEALAFQGKMICSFPHPYTVAEPEFNIFNDATELIQLIQKGGKRVSAEVSEKYWKPNWSENIKFLTTPETLDYST